MQFYELIKEIKEVVFDTLRADRGDYFEAVILKDGLPELSFRLERLFGLPLWPPKNKLSAKVKNAIKDFGGIMQGQTLYFYEQNSCIIFAMLWPWQDNRHITLKIAQK